ncbi:hypothetical protein D9758_009031 [Tetrapyrgos nigripes]|uniref:Uncharacterized protein n=1 Tax=Tetrapyrgos nigripes TaxID=182062 RepID=A0A8H5GAD0_9AGAR|nr:hypothetical protein D9758_009031 [Tetrapyrgos nigripes]
MDSQSTSDVVGPSTTSPIPTASTNDSPGIHGSAVTTTVPLHSESGIGSIGTFQTQLSAAPHGSLSRPAIVTTFGYLPSIVDNATPSPVSASSTSSSSTTSTTLSTSTARTTPEVSGTLTSKWFSRATEIIRPSSNTAQTFANVGTNKQKRRISDDEDEVVQERYDKRLKQDIPHIPDENLDLQHSPADDASHQEENFSSTTLQDVGPTGEASVPGASSSAYLDDNEFAMTLQILDCCLPKDSGNVLNELNKVLRGVDTPSPTPCDSTSVPENAQIVVEDDQHRFPDVRSAPSTEQPADIGGPVVHGNDAGAQQQVYGVVNAAAQPQLYHGGVGHQNIQQRNICTAGSTISSLPYTLELPRNFQTFYGTSLSPVNTPRSSGIPQAFVPPHPPRAPSSTVYHDHATPGSYSSSAYGHQNLVTTSSAASNGTHPVSIPTNLSTSTRSRSRHPPPVSFQLPKLCQWVKPDGTLCGVNVSHLTSQDKLYDRHLNLEHFIKEADRRPTVTSSEGKKHYLCYWQGCGMSGARTWFKKHFKDHLYEL